MNYFLDIFKRTWKLFIQFRFGCLLVWMSIYILTSVIGLPCNWYMFLRFTWILLWSLLKVECAGFMISLHRHSKVILYNAWNYEIERNRLKCILMMLYLCKHIIFFMNFSDLIKHSLCRIWRACHLFLYRFTQNNFVT